ncbi:hypothetical protein EUGRSUZ_H02177 [Eucalyptus grandis]|uniref:Uncharacterized protein n=2 Tax=Eucalyptus grandis TaxID=71139 RepID=A0ACC3JR19_EUCGR|nr:hypothetical protein EUGRSUZ_H02177 [Eucalyptus grandis]
MALGREQSDGGVGRRGRTACPWYSVSCSVQVFSVLCLMRVRERERETRQIRESRDSLRRILEDPKP